MTTEARRSVLPAVLVVAGLVLLIGGGVWYAQSTQTSLEDEADDAATALLQLQCEQTGEGCEEAEAPNSSDREEPARLAVAAVGGVLLIAGIVIASRRDTRGNSS